MGNSFIFDDEETDQTEGMDAETEAGGEEPGGDEGGNNRTFLIAVGVLGGIVLIALLCLAAYAGLVLPRQRQAQQAQAEAQLVQNTQTAQAATETAAATVAGPAYTVQPGDTLLSIAAQFGITVDDLRNANPGVGDSPTPGQIIIIPGVVGPLPSPAPATNTPVVVFPTSTQVVVATVDPITATVAAAYTQAALAQLTVIPTSTALGAVPETGFADQVGLPVLFALGAVFLVVIFVVRRVRTAQ